MTDPAPSPSVPTPAAPSPGKRRTLTPEERAQRAEAARLKREARVENAAPVVAPPVTPPPAAPAPVPVVAPVVHSAGVRRLARVTPVYVSSGRKRQVLIPARKRIITHTISTPTSSRPK